MKNLRSQLVGLIAGTVQTCVSCVPMLSWDSGGLPEPGWARVVKSTQKMPLLKITAFVDAVKVRV